ncbi:hypothetical protein T265_05459 [Opisthorchis viverrini]|uniref:Uncharacterized protein n=1 Tax=Opisthorchis viverrini TaxID=6198 RepID=A0A074ZJH6_OPIVI|nr:hypothetical protein T265_05459 [Opisthorchis viverrini]KER27498.1 hypothetical protein T265_05459 [Opisthorchis viverrini]
MVQRIPLPGDSAELQVIYGSNPTSASGLPLSRLGQPGSIPAFVLPSGGMADQAYMRIKYTGLLRNTLVCKTLNPGESLVYDVSRPLKVPHQTASCFSRYDIQDIATHVYSQGCRKSFSSPRPLCHSWGPSSKRSPRVFVNSCSTCNGNMRWPGAAYQLPGNITNQRFIWVPVEGYHQNERFRCNAVESSAETNIVRK